LFFFLLFATISYLVVTKGFSYVKDNLIGHPTKELLEDEWVYSEYGSPNIAIETPKVLKRIDVSKTIPAEFKQMLSSNSTFQYGSLIDNFQVAVSTFSLKEETKIEIDKGIDATVQSYIQTVGAQVVTIDKTDIETKNGKKAR